MRQAEVAIGDVLLAGEDRQDARQRARRGCVNFGNLRMGVRGAHECCVQLVWDRYVIGVTAGTANEPQILEARHWLADVAVAGARAGLD